MSAARWAVAAGTLALAALLAGSAYWLAPAAREPDPSAYRSGADQFGALRERLAAEHDVQAVVSRLSLVPDDGLLVVLRPEVQPDAATEDALLGRLQRGGSMWVADPGPAWSGLLGRLGIAVGTQPLLDLAPLKPGQVALSTTAAVASGVTAFAPTTLLLQDPAWEPFLVSSPSSALDVDGNGTIDRGDLPGPHVVGALRHLDGGGTLLVTSDASLATGAGLAAEPNRRLVDWIAGQAAAPGVWLDETQHGHTAAERGPANAVATLQRATEQPWTLKAAAAGLVAVVAGLAVLLVPRRLPFAAHAAVDPILPPEPPQPLREDNP